MRFPSSSLFRAALLCGAAAVPSLRAQTPAATPPPVAPAGQFPIAVWLQSSANAARYKAAGINVYVGLSDELGTASLDALAKQDMHLIVEQTPATLAFKGSPVITAWMHGDEPDNAQEIPKEKGGGYGPPITPEKIVAEYQQMKKADPARPVILNLGMGVAWDGWFGRGVRTNHPEDYPAYAKGADILSFDIYPVVTKSIPAEGKLEVVPFGVQRLMDWKSPQQTVWNCIECTHISNPAVKPTPAQVRSEVWMSLIHGSTGLIYFVHQFAPSFREPALLDDPEMVAAVTALNKQIQDLAPVLSSPSVANMGWSAAPGEPIRPVQPPLAMMTKKHGGDLYVFAANLDPRQRKVALSRPDSMAAMSSEAEVVGEGRKVVGEASFTDTFEPYGVHIYHFKGVK